jgi:hypothetical protein
MGIREIWWERQKERSRGTWEVYIKDDFTYVGCEVVEWIYLAQDSVQRKVLVREITSFFC